MLAGIETKTSCNFFSNRQYFTDLADKIVYTGPIDEFYNYKFGKLEYRTVYFQEEVYNMCNYQGNAVINYTAKEIPYTRIIEHKHFEMFGNEVETIDATVISKEFSTEWRDGMEPYYPINDKRNSEIYSKYKDLCKYP